MSKKEELFRKLREGLPVGEAATLVEKVQQEDARERAPKTNPFRYKDKYLQRLSDLWFSQRKTATIEQKNQVGLTYISKVLGLGDDIARDFAQGDRNAYHRVGMRQSGVEKRTLNLKGFWTKIQELFPGKYTDEDIAFLIKQEGIEAVWNLQWQLEIPLAEESPVLKNLSINAHVYK